MKGRTKSNRVVALLDDPYNQCSFCDSNGGNEARQQLARIGPTLDVQIGMTPGSSTPALVSPTGQRAGTLGWWIPALLIPVWMPT